MGGFIGRITGAITGAVGGFLVGGPWGAAAGAVLGFAGGAAQDEANYQQAKAAEDQRDALEAQREAAEENARIQKNMAEAANRRKRANMLREQRMSRAQAMVQGQGQGAQIGDSGMQGVLQGAKGQLLSNTSVFNSMARADQSIYDTNMATSRTVGRLEASASRSMQAASSAQYRADAIGKLQGATIGSKDFMNSKMGKSIFG